MASLSGQLTDPSSGSFKGPFFSHGPLSTSPGPGGRNPLDPGAGREIRVAGCLETQDGLTQGLRSCIRAPEKQLQVALNSDHRALAAVPSKGLWEIVRSGPGSSEASEQVGQLWKCSFLLL